MAASVVMALDPAVRQPSESARDQEPTRHALEEIGAAMTLVSVAKESVPDDGASVLVAKVSVLPVEEVKRVDNPVVGTGGASIVEVEPLMDDAQLATTEALKTESVEANDAISATAVPTPLPPKRPLTPTHGKSAKKAQNALGIPTAKKKKKKSAKTTIPECTHVSFGVYVDALDKKLKWGCGKIIDVDEANAKIKVTFPGFNKNWDIWTDLLSIAPHGTKAKPRKGLNAKSWDGHTDLFTGERSSEGAVACTSPKSSIHHELVVAPSKPPRAIKKGYKLEVITESDPEKFTIKKEPVSSKRKRPAARESPLASADDSTARQSPTPVAATAVNKRVRVVKDAVAASVPSPKLVASPVHAPLSDPTIRDNNIAAMDASAAFLQRCLDVWKRQLHNMSAAQHAELLIGGRAVVEH